jgi:AcrR family transcriptional regulator
MNEITQRILEVSRDLFIEEGYKKTTTRQIIQKAGILNGSLYHFFENKEAIFKHIMVDIYEETENLSKNLAEKYSDSILGFALLPALQLYVVGKHEKLAELFHEAYSAWPILDLFTKKTSERMQNLFHDYNPDFSEQDYYLNTLSIVGCARNFIAESYFMGDIDYQDKLAIALKMFQLLFNIPAFDVSKTIAKIDHIINTEEIVIYGVRI